MKSIVAGRYTGLFASINLLCPKLPSSPVAEDQFFWERPHPIIILPPIRQTILVANLNAILDGAVSKQ